MISVHQNRIQISRRRFVRVNIVIVLSKILLKIFYSPGFRETIFYMRRANNFLLFRYFIKNRLTNDSRECRFSFAFFLLSDQRERLVYVQLVFFFFFLTFLLKHLKRSDVMSLGPRDRKSVECCTLKSSVKRVAFDVTFIRRHSKSSCKSSSLVSSCQSIKNDRFYEKRTKLISQEVKWRLRRGRLVLG